VQRLGLKPVTPLGEMSKIRKKTEGGHYRVPKLRNREEEKEPEETTYRRKLYEDVPGGRGG